MENTSTDDIHYVYLISDGIASVKIGMTNNLEKRIKELQTANPNKLVMVDAFWCKSRFMAWHVECIMHNMFEKYRKYGEWFEADKIMKWYENNCLGESTKIGCYEWKQKGAEE